MIEDSFTNLIRSEYTQAKGDSTRLFQTILTTAAEIGLDQALACLETCVIEKRLAWLDRNLNSLERSTDPVWDGYQLFYEVYLGVSAPKDGQIVARDKSRLVTRWWNPCPTLEACQKLGLDTRQVCQKAYLQPVQEMLSKIDPRLRFTRNEQAIRPYAAYCEEIIYLED